MMLRFFKRRRSPARHVQQLTREQVADLMVASAWCMTEPQWHSLTDFERAECRRNITIAPRFTS